MSMRLPAPLLRRQKNVHKNNFGHVLILAGSPRMLGAAALSAMAAMRCGTGLVTVGIPQSLNNTLQKKINAGVMTLPLPETKKKTLALKAFREIAEFHCDVIALGPGMSQEPQTQKLILKIISQISKPLVIDADALNSLAKYPNALLKTSSVKIVTPHPGEMARLTRLTKEVIEKKRKEVAKDFAAKYKTIVVLKGHHTVVASPEGKIYINHTGNPGMAKAGSGDVLTGMIAALLGQGIPAFQSACLGCFLHGKAGDLAAIEKSRVSMIATDMVDLIPKVFKKFYKRLIKTTGD